MGHEMRNLSLVLATVLLGVAASGAAPADEVLRIDRAVWSVYQTYLQKIGSTRPGAFAVTVDGYGAYWVTCPGTQCIGATTYSHDAKQDCEQDSGMDCVVFAVRDDIRVQYEIRE